MTSEFTKEVLQVLTCSLKNNILTATVDEQEVIADFVSATSPLKVSALTVTICNENEYYDEEDFLLCICTSAVDCIYGPSQQGEERASLFEKVCQVANAYLAELRLAAEEELTLVERHCITLAINPRPMRTFMQD